MRWVAMIGGKETSKVVSNALLLAHYDIKRTWRKDLGRKGKLQAAPHRKLWTTPYAKGSVLYFFLGEKSKKKQPKKIKLRH